MDAELKAKWLAALRSGKYAQGDGKLRGTNGRFCCLGVLCDVYDPTRWQEHDRDACFQYSSNTAFLPTELADGIEEYTLTTMNDNGVPFAEIADWIEANL